MVSRQKVNVINSSMKYANPTALVVRYDLFWSYASLATRTQYQCEQLLWARIAANASCGPEQVQLLQLYKSKIRDRAMHHQEKGEQVHVGQCNARAPACCAVQCINMAQCSLLFLNERTGLHKIVFFKDE